MVVETASSCSSLLTIFTSLLDITPHQKFYSKIPSRGKIRLSTYIQLWQAENATTNICEAQSFVVYWKFYNRLLWSSRSTRPTTSKNMRHLGILYHGYMLQYELICTDTYQLSNWIEHQYQKNAALDIVAKTVSTCEARKIIVPWMFLSSNLPMSSCLQYVTRHTPKIWDYFPRVDICYTPIINVDGVRIDNYWNLQLCWRFMTRFTVHLLQASQPL